MKSAFTFVFALISYMAIAEDFNDERLTSSIYSEFELDSLIQVDDWVTIDSICSKISQLDSAKRDHAFEVRMVQKALDCVNPNVLNVFNKYDIGLYNPTLDSISPIHYFFDDKFEQRIKNMKDDSLRHENVMERLYLTIMSMLSIQRHVSEEDMRFVVSRKELLKKMVTPWSVEPRTLAPDDSIFYKDINTNDLHTTMVLDSLMRYDVNSKVNADKDMLIAKIAYYSDGSLAEDMGSVINKAIFTKPGFLTNISNNKLYYFGALYTLYCELFVFDVDQGTFEDKLNRYMNSLPEHVLANEKMALSDAFVIIHNQTKDNL